MKSSPARPANVLPRWRLKPRPGVTAATGASIGHAGSRMANFRPRNTKLPMPIPGGLRIQSQRVADQIEKATGMDLTASHDPCCWPRAA